MDTLHGSLSQFPIAKAHCNLCSHETKHAILQTARKDRSKDGMEDVVDYQMLQCLGCDSVKLREGWSALGCGEVMVSYWPPANSTRRLPPWLSEWATGARGAAGASILVFLEIYAALHNGQPHLAAMGVRSLLEHIMVSSVGDLGSFGSNLAAFAEAGHVSPKQKERLVTILEVGHATIHRGYTPTNEDLAASLDILEHIIASLYVHDGAVSAAKARVPPRAKRSTAPDSK